MAEMTSRTCTSSAAVDVCPMVVRNRPGRTLASAPSTDSTTGPTRTCRRRATASVSTAACPLPRLLSLLPAVRFHRAAAPARCIPSLFGCCCKAPTTALHAPRSPRRRLFSESPADTFRRRVQHTPTTPACSTCCFRAATINDNSELCALAFDEHIWQRKVTYQGPQRAGGCKGQNAGGKIMNHLSRIAARIAGSAAMLRRAPRPVSCICAL